MKHLILKSFLALLLVCFVSNTDVYAQKFYRCVANKVAVRKNPSPKAAIARYQGQGQEENIRLYITKDQVVRYDGKKRNGYIFITITNDRWYQEGWVPAKYFTPAKKCDVCNGTGHLDTLCPECEGECCPPVLGGGVTCIDGYEWCETCKGTGYR